MIVQVALKQICKNLIVYEAANAKKIVKMLGNLSYKLVITYHMSCRIFEFVYLAPKNSPNNGPNGPGQLSNSC